MVNIYCAYTAPINPSSLNPPSKSRNNIPTWDSLDAPAESPLLTREQCWVGLQRKIRDATEFVGAIATCKVLGEEEDKDGEGHGDKVVTRVVTFNAEPEKEVKEVCRSYWPMKVSSRDFFLFLFCFSFCSKMRRKGGRVGDRWRDSEKTEGRKREGKRGEIEGRSKKKQDIRNRNWRSKSDQSKTDGITFFPPG